MGKVVRGKGKRIGAREKGKGGREKPHKKISASGMLSFSGGTLKLTFL